jgi:hypothetical protein
MKVIGYSERGMVNALFYEINYSTTPESLLGDLLSRVAFPFLDTVRHRVHEAEVLIEQSFSDFGAADVLLLLKTQRGPISVFVEAKAGTGWSIEKEFRDFVDGTQTQVSSSNLFTQLYHKVRLVAGLRQGSIPALKKGLTFPQSSTKRIRKIGGNRVVLRAVSFLAEHLDETYYVALVPEPIENLDRFFPSLLTWVPPVDYYDWDVRAYGYLSWSDVEGFCSENHLEDTRHVLKFNEMQPKL